MKRQATELGLSMEEIDEILNAICARAEESVLSHEWQPILRDPDDEPLVQLTVESGADCLVSHNTRDLAPAVALGVELLQPRDFLAKLRA